MKWIEEENRKIILETLNKKALTFGELLEMKIVSRTALSSHLDKLKKSGDIQKKYDSQRKRVVYQLRSKAITELRAKSWIRELGETAVHYIVRQKLKKPTEHPYDIFKLIDQYLKIEQPKPVSWKQLFNFLEKEHPLII